MTYRQPHHTGSGDSPPRRAIIIGVTGDIGCKLAAELQQRGWSVDGTYREGPAGIVPALPEDVRGWPLDLSSLDGLREGLSIDTRLEMIAEGGYDAVVYAAGMDIAAPFSMPVQKEAGLEERLLAAYNVNLVMADLALRRMVATLETPQGPRPVVNKGAGLMLLGSAASEGNPFNSSYAAAKRGMHGLVRSVFLEQPHLEDWPYRLVLAEFPYVDLGMGHKALRWYGKMAPWVVDKVKQQGYIMQPEQLIAGLADVLESGDFPVTMLPQGFTTADLHAVTMIDQIPRRLGPISLDWLREGLVRAYDRWPIRQVGQWAIGSLMYGLMGKSHHLPATSLKKGRPAGSNGNGKSAT